MMKEDMCNMSNSTFPTFNVSSSQTDMDDCQDLETNRHNGAGMRRARSLQHVFPSLQKQQHHLPRKSPSTPSFNDQSAWVHEYNDKHSVGCFSLSVYEVLSSKSKQKEDEAQKEKIHETQDVVFTQTFESDHKLDKHLATYKSRSHVPGNNERFLENQSQKNNRSIVRSIDRGKTSTQKTYDQRSTEDRSVQFPSTHSPIKSEPGSDAKGRALGSWQLFRDEHLDTSKSGETKNTSSVSYNKSSGKRNKVSLPKLQDVPCQLFDQLKDELRDFTEKDMRLLNADRRETFAKLFGIHKIFPLYLDRSEFVMWFLDENECLFMWNQMECSIIYMGSNLEEGTTNYLIHPNRMCYVIEDTFERVPVDKYEQQLKEDYKNYMEEDFEKKILEAKAKANLVIPKRKKARKKSSKSK